MGMDKDEIFEAAWLMDQVWGVWEDDTQDGGRGTGVQQECNNPSDIRYHGKLMAWYKTQQWEAPSTLMAAFDPEPIFAVPQMSRTVPGVADVDV